ncbi:hypothetical protein F3Y22_tig00112857pilonHSYRG00056 [Hibiscus syriacus]|uniref:RNase H type-1 domain-containing protein n=1 Tax=Hibiscus syriacus TaxID=106335 RepID=A0A6A2XYU7_HIBSY|nr:hypothetical protein F3Y22_tig00112857pilonHSYRG00056 [Hibiscus syriacus]
MTNVERCRRSIVHQPHCPCCLEAVETTTLALRNCRQQPILAFSFASTLWQIWKNRNDMTFNRLDSLAVSIATRSITWARYYSESSCTGVHIRNSIAAPIHWHPPSGGWMCLNTEGVVSSGTATGSIGGLFRDNEKSWISGFNKKIGITNPLQLKKLSVSSMIIKLHQAPTPWFEQLKDFATEAGLST